MNMTKTQKALVCILSVLLCISMTLCISLYRATRINPNQMDITYISLDDEKIPKDMKDQSIAFFTDLEYGTYQNKKRTKKFFKELKHLNPDILLIGGDLFDQSYMPSEEEIQYIIQSLQGITAPLGKFAVFGEQDVFSSERKQIVERIYQESEVEVLNNQNHSISNTSMPSIHVIGMSTNPSWNQALSSIREDEFNILLCHMPDFLLSHELNHMPIDYALAGHSHGDQISIPIKGGYKSIKGAKQMNRNNSEKVPFDYHISSGVGCVDVDARLRSTPEIVYILLS